MYVLRLTLLALVLGALSGACAHGGLGGSASDSEGSNSDSGNSSDSDGSSQGSEGSSDGTEGSGAASNESGQSSQDSGDNTEQSSGEESTEQSSADSTQDSTDGTSSRGEEQVTQGPVLTTAGVLITGAAVGLIFWLDRDVVNPDRAAVTGEVTRRWLAANAHQLALDLALGAGPALDDLAGAAGITGGDRAAFGRALRAHRSELLALADPKRLDRARAFAFLERAGEIARSQPALAEAYRAFADRVAAAAPVP